MFSDSMTLYKLMILYMLNNVNFPLTNNQISDFFLTNEYTDYFTLQKALSELKEADMMLMESTHNSSRYTISQEGIQTLSYLEKDISTPIKEDINSYLKENKLRMRNEVSTDAFFYQTPNLDYIVSLKVNEGKTPLIHLELAVPEEDQAKYIRDNWQYKNQEIYQYIIMKLISSKDS